MKKIIALLGSVLLFTGLKAQKDSSIKKETTPVVRPRPADSLKNTPATIVKPARNKNTLPSKGIIIPDTDKPTKAGTISKPSKY